VQWIILQGVRPYDGRYELDLATNRATTVEWGWIKRFSGYLPANADQGFEGNDPELMAALAVIALHRAGKVQPRDVQDVFDVIAAAPVGDTIRFDNDDPDTDDRVVDASPPAARSNGNEPSSGEGSTTSSETSTSDPSSTGIPASASSGSDPLTSGT
jgi:hypothetical protein